MTLQSDLAYSILCEAAASEHGIEVEIHDPAPPVVGKTLRAKQILYRSKKDNPDLFASLVIRLSPTDPDNFLWITKQ